MFRFLFRFLPHPPRGARASAGITVRLERIGVPPVRRVAAGLLVAAAGAVATHLGPPAPLGAQTPEPQPPVAEAAISDGAPHDHAATAPVAQAVRTTQPLVIDGVLDEAVWMTAPPITDFYKVTLDVGTPISQPTEVRFLYDDDHIYVGAWLWDDGEILTRLARRDAGVPDADFFIVLFDSYHDHRTAYRFATSPSGMKRDEIVTAGYGGGGGGGGGFGDTSWDPVWDIKTSITEEGWFVEMRIPFSQLRYRGDSVQTWGLQVERKIRRYGEDTVWAYTPPEERGGVARYGHLVGIEGIQQGKRLEVLPYLTGRAELRDVPQSAAVGFSNPYRSGRDVFGNYGVDLKYRMGSNLTLDATVNPDFGQVEMDPAVINLTAFETRFAEQRPFFVEGSEIFRFGDGGGSGGGADAQLVYSRRIGRSPQGVLPGSAAYADMPSNTTILGAMKLTGKTADGWSMGVLNAVTARETAPWIGEGELVGETEVEPLSNYFAGRVRRDLRDGAAAFGVIGTAVYRDLENPTLEGRLHSSAFTAGVDGRIEWANRAWVLAGKVSRSLVRGSDGAILRTQQSSARYFQRPDADHLDFDPTATSLSGFLAKLDLAKQAGAWQGSLGLTALSPEYEANDLGFQNWADRIDLSASFGYEQPRISTHFRRLSVRVSPGATLNFAGDVVGASLNTSVSGQLMSFHGFNARLGRSFETWDDRLTRGGPLTRSPAGYSGNLGFNTDSRGFWSVRAGVRFAEDDGGGWQRGGNVNLSIRLREIYEFQIGPDLTRSRNAAQFVTSLAHETADHTFGRRYVFAEIDQTTVSLDTRFNVTFTPELTLELYAQPFISSGDYFGLKELARPRSFEFLEYGVDAGSTIVRGEDGRYTVDARGDGAHVFQLNDQDFNLRSLLGNAVLRWEWRTGSTFFLVWQQVRSERLVASAGGSVDRTVGSFEPGRDARALFQIKPENIFMLKMTYWLNP